MIIVCFGLHKSASTLTYQTVLRLAALGSPAQLFWCEENWSQPNYGKVARINDRYLKKYYDIATSEQHLLIQKTHLSGDRLATSLSKRGHLKTLISLRDPRDIVLSLLDAGKIERSKGKSSSVSRIYSIHDAVSLIEKDIESLIWWRENSEAIFVPYDSIAFDFYNSAFKISDYLFGNKISPIEAKTIWNSFFGDEIRLNVGARDRHINELSTLQNREIRDYFSDFYERFDGLCE